MDKKLDSVCLIPSFIMLLMTMIAMALMFNILTNCKARMENFREVRTKVFAEEFGDHPVKEMQTSNGETNVSYYKDMITGEVIKFTYSDETDTYSYEKIGVQSQEITDSELEEDLSDEERTAASIIPLMFLMWG